MPRPRLIILTFITMFAFADNTLFCRMALKLTGIDAASFTTIRLISGAATLWLFVASFSGHKSGAGSWRSAAALFAYSISTPTSLRKPRWVRRCCSVRFRRP